MPSGPGSLLAEVARDGDVSAVMSAVSDSLRAWIGVGPVFLATADPATGSFTSTFTFDVPGDAAAAFYAIEMAGRDVVPFGQLAGSGDPVGSLFRATQGEPESSERWREVISPLGWGDEVRAAVTSHGTTWGYLCLHREAHERAFSPRELTRLTALLPGIAAALRMSALANRDTTDRLPPGVLIVDDQGRLAGSTGGAAAWLDELGPCLPSGLPLLISGIARSALARREPVTTTVLTRAGRAGVIDAAVLEQDGPAQVAVVISGAPPSHLLERLAAASGLSAREREVVAAVAAGRSTRDIAERLSISPYTVQAHLTSVYSKTGIRTRRELVARLSR